MRTGRSWSPVAALSLGVVMLWLVPAIAADGAPRVVRNLNDAVLAVLQQQTAPLETKSRAIRSIVEQYVDFETMSQLVLARNWRALNGAEKEEFVEQFKKYLSATYGKNLEAYRDEKVEVGADRDEGRGDWTVQTRIVRADGGSPLLVDYRLRLVRGEWKVIDLVVERVSLVSSFRSQFQGIFASGGFPGLLNALREKNGGVRQGSSATADDHA